MRGSGWFVLVAIFGVMGCASQRPAAPPGGVVSVSAVASGVGNDVLVRGGNAVDAAVATAFALAVAFPEAGNIGGGGFMLVHVPDGRDPVVIDYREAAPAAATAEMFVRKADRTQHRLAGVPGTVRGLALAHEKYGKLPWRELVSPAVGLARDGFAVDDDLAKSLGRALADKEAPAEFRRVFAPPDGKAWKAGDRLVQTELAKTLDGIADKGAEGFYGGAVADAIVAEMGRGGGLITKADLAGYRAEVRAPVHGTYRGYDVYGPPPPSSGGAALIEMLNVLENFSVSSNGRYSSVTLHLMTETMRRAYADRAKHLGDPAFVQNPVARLTDKEYARGLARGIDLRRATPSAELAGDVPLREEPANTTHFSVVDSAGMAVSNTYTLEESYGGKVIVAGAGFLLNNELGDFNPQPGVTTRTGQIGTAANVAAPGKRPLSSMTPTIVCRGGRVVMVTGSPGGRTIINTVLCVLVNSIDYGMSPRDSVDAPRQHHAWWPDRIQMEEGVMRGRSAVLDSLRAMGHTIDPTPRRQGDAHSIFWDAKTRAWVGVEDRRRSGGVAGFGVESAARKRAG